MKNKILLYIGLTPIIIFLEMYYISSIGELLSNQSDISVLVGLLSLSLFLVGNVYLIYKFIKTIKL